LFGSSKSRFKKKKKRKPKEERNQTKKMSDEKKQKTKCHKEVNEEEEKVKESTIVECRKMGFNHKGRLCEKVVEKFAFPICDANPGLIKTFQCLKQGDCVWIVPKNSFAITFYIGTFVSFDCGVVTLNNAFTTATFALAILSATSVGVIPPTLSPPLVPASFAGKIAIDICDISSVITLNGDFCTFINTLITTGTISNGNVATALLTAMAPSSSSALAAQLSR
jgi:hypothetical protein